MIITVNNYPFTLVEFQVGVTGEGNSARGYFITKAKYSNLIFGFSDIKVRFIELRKR